MYTDSGVSQASHVCKLASWRERQWFWVLSRHLIMARWVLWLFPTLYPLDNSNKSTSLCWPLTSFQLLLASKSTSSLNETPVVSRTCHVPFYCAFIPACLSAWNGINSTFCPLGLISVPIFLPSRSRSFLPVCHLQYLWVIQLLPCSLLGNWVEHLCFHGSFLF